MPSFLTMFRSNNPAAYDENKCLKDFNNFSKYHNEQLQSAIEELKQEFPRARIQYADYYNMLMEIIVNSTSLGKLLAAQSSSHASWTVPSFTAADGIFPSFISRIPEGVLNEGLLRNWRRLQFWDE